MTVKRIVTNIESPDPAKARAFYGDLLGLKPVMDLGWIVSYGSDTTMSLQINITQDGGSGTPTPDISIEVEDVDAVYDKATAAGFEITYGPVDEPWGIRRFYVRDPFGKLVNISQHI